MKKICSKCKDEKDLDEFSLHKKGKLGRHPQCNLCRSKYERIRYAKGEREKRKQFRPYTYETRLWSKYKLTLKDYNNILEKQNHCCAICKKKKPLVVDHNHETKQVRGLLCTKCNTGLGKFNDNVDALKEAIKYMESWSSGL